MYVVSLIASNAGASRLAVSAPARLGTAVRRNRARRRTRAAFAPLLPRLHPHSDVVVTVRAAALEASFGGLSGSAESLLRELGRLDARP
jgi:ribonuclease P protein component